MSYVLNRISQAACSEVASLRGGSLVIVDSSGGLVASALVLRELIVAKGLRVRFIGECSSAAMLLLGCSPRETFGPMAFGKLHKPTRLGDEGEAVLEGQHLAILEGLWNTITQVTHAVDGQEVDVQRLVAISDALRTTQF